MGTPASPARTRWSRGLRATSLAAVGVCALTPLAVSTAGGAAPASAQVSASDVRQAASPVGTTMPSATRKASAPNVAYPLPASVKPKDLRSYKEGSHRGTEIQAPCGTTVRSLIPGTVKLIDSAYSGGTMVSVATSEGRLTTYYAFMQKIVVTDGQILSAGQPIGQVGDEGAANGCMLRLEVRQSGTTGHVDPTAWLEKYVGKPVPDSTIFGNSGFTVASFNALGKSHTDPGGDARSYPSYTVRTPKYLDYINAKKMSVVGMQEFQKPQFTLFQKKAGKTFGLYPPSTKYDTENAIAWRTSEFDLVEGHRIGITYFNGSTRQMPYVLLKQKSTGRTAWFINVHNPADTYQYKNQGKYRAKAVATEKALVIQLRRSNRPVFLTGDMNDRTTSASSVFCQITGGKLAISADSIPSMTCAPPASVWIDWVFAAGQARFSSYVRDYSTRSAKITDHPAVYARTFLSE